MRSLTVPRPFRLIGLLATLGVVLCGCPDEPDSYVCGNRACESGSGENESNCPIDCAPAVCGNHVCEAVSSETPSTCPADCMSVPTCGDGSCNGIENSGTCLSDCPERCGDGHCGIAEKFNGGCQIDCPVSTVCGDGRCERDENASTCAVDCYVASCPNGICDVGESEFNCFADCNDHCAARQIDCFADNYCWPDGTNCTGNLLSCNGLPFRCANNADWAYCCGGGGFAICPAAFPYYCPSTQLCYATPPSCSISTCSLVTADCGL